VTPEECLVIYGEAWFERDPARRAEGVRRCCREGIECMRPTLDRMESVGGVSDMSSQRIGSTWATTPADALQPRREGRRGRSGRRVSVEVVTPIEYFHGFFRYSFVWKLPDGSLGPGTDFCEVADDGRMRLITVWPGSDDFPVPSPREH